MSTRIRWYTPSRIISQEFTNTVTMEDIRVASSTTNDMIKNGIAPVHTIINLQDVTEFPKNIEKIRAAMQSEAHANRGWIILVLPETNLLMRLVASRVIRHRAYNQSFRMFGSVSQALMFLESVDPTLNLTATNIAES